MKKNIFLIIALLLFQFMVNAQKKIKPTFTSINQVGVVWGSSDDGLQVQTINGLVYKTFSTGLGLGLDYYLERSVPIFFDVRKNIFSKKQTPFIYGDLGINMPWIIDEETWYSSEHDPGLYWDLGIGYKVPINNKLFANISFGYTQKKFQEERINKMSVGIFPYEQKYTQHYNYTLRRFSLKAGLSF